MSASVVCFTATQHHNLLIPSPTLVNTFFTSNNAILTPTTQTHSFYTFNKKTPKNRYTRKQPTHFSMTP